MVDISVRVNEYNGDNLIKINFLDTWDVKEVRMAGHNAPSMTDHQIRETLVNPIETPTIGELAKGKKGRIAVVCDDLMRSTPTHVILPYIIEELNDVGISDDQIFILGATGAHMQMTVDAFARKIGWDMVARFDCVSHNPWQNFIDLGLTERRTPLLINKEFVKADLRISISGIKHHGNAGAGGGGKIVLPGVSSMQTILWNHTYVRYKYNSGAAADTKVGAWNIRDNEARADMQEAARRANLDLSVNCSYNNNRELIGLHIGDLDSAWREAVKFTYGMHATSLPDKKADIVVVNNYMRADASISWSMANQTLREGGSAVAINQVPGVGGASLGHYFQTLDACWTRLQRYPKRRWPVKQAGNIVVYTDKPVRRQMFRYSEEVEWITDWQKVLKRLKELHGEGAVVYVFPSAAIQFDPAKSPLVL